MESNKILETLMKARLNGRQCSNFLRFLSAARKHHLEMRGLRYYDASWMISYWNGKVLADLQIFEKAATLVITRISSDMMVDIELSRRFDSIDCMNLIAGTIAKHIKKKTLTLQQPPHNLSSGGDRCVAQIVT